MDASKDSDLKNLLISWRCEILYDLFTEEEIGLEELKYIKYRHVCHLLLPYKMGIRIRFEHYLDKWRNNIGKPIKDVEFQNHCIADKYSCYFQHQTNAPMINGKQTVNESPEKSSNLYISSVDVDISHKMASSAQVLKSPQKVAETDCSNDDTIPKQERSHILRSSHKSPRAKPPADVNLSDYLVNAMDKGRQQCPFKLAEILRRSGAKGSALIKYSGQRKEFTNVQRSQLIQIICEFFEEHDYHLSLSTSHDIEEEILEMFPMEKLHYYRTEKRGKIYVKFTNMKRYKRETLPYKRYKAAGDRILRDLAVGEDESHIPVQNMSEGGNGENNMDTTSCDTWPETAEPEICIKAETED